MTDELQRLADGLTADYLHGRWRPEATEAHRARILSAQVSIDAGLDGLAAADGVLTAASIDQMLRPHPQLDTWRLAPVLRVYPAGTLEAQALVRDLLDAIAVSGFPLLPPRPLRYVEAPARHDGGPAALFLGGGITGCPDWQRRAALQLDAIGSPAVVLNPRREAFPLGQAEAAREQTAWEYEHLRLADVILFWFCAEAVQPIALYELGAHAARGVRLAVGAHPEYPRRLDVLEQLRLARPDVTVHDSLQDTVRAAAALLPPGPARP
ncbi:nucleoside 2-deoxyribosyltransferase domain-containing protein [Streptomyces sp. NPDC002623]